LVRRNDQPGKSRKLSAVFRSPRARPDIRRFQL
jgi:hypothetical protein